MDQQKIQYFLLNVRADYINWYKNPPASSHMEGVWERQIRSTRNIMLSLLNTNGKSLKDESLRTLLAKTKSVLNFRPLTLDTLGNVQTEPPLCPSNILTMKSKVFLPPAADFNCCIQHVANEFWVRWRKLFLWTLPTRSKWKKMRKLSGEGHRSTKDRGQAESVANGKSS